MSQFLEYAAFKTIKGNERKTVKDWQDDIVGEFDRTQERLMVQVKSQLSQGQTLEMAGSLKLLVKLFNDYTASKEEVIELCDAAQETLLAEGNAQIKQYQATIRQLRQESHASGTATEARTAAELQKLARSAAALDQKVQSKASNLGTRSFQKKDEYQKIGPDFYKNDEKVARRLIPAGSLVIDDDGNAKPIESIRGGSRRHHHRRRRQTRR